MNVAGVTPILCLPNEVSNTTTWAIFGMWWGLNEIDIGMLLVFVSTVGEL